MNEGQTRSRNSRAQDTEGTEVRAMMREKAVPSDICLPSAFPRSYVRVLRGIRK